MLLDDLVYSRRRTPAGFVPSYLIGCNVVFQRGDREPAMHLLRLRVSDDTLIPICGSGDRRWTHDNQETTMLDDVTCGNCQRMIAKMERNQ